MPSTRFFVARTRLSRIRSLAVGVRRWLMFSPIRLTTASTPSKEASGGRSPVGSQACQETVGFVLRARAGSRLSAATSSPRASRASQTDAPISPLAPVTSTRTGAPFYPAGFGLLDRRERAGLLGDAG